MCYNLMQLLVIVHISFNSIRKKKIDDLIYLINKGAFAPMDGPVILSL